MKLSDQKWIKAIPQSQNHGSGTLQKRLWRVTSDYIRIRDFEKYGRYVDTGNKIYDWKESQAGHFISYSVCNGMFKWDEDNIHAQSATGNSWGGMVVGHNYGAELERRGIIPEELRSKNRDTELKVNDTLVTMKIVYYLTKMANLEHKPAYYSRVVKLLEEEQRPQDLW